MQDIRASSQPVPESGANRHRMRRDSITLGLCAAAYFLAHYIAFIFPDSEKVLMAVWPVGGIGLAALLLNERRLWPHILIAFFIAGNSANLIVGRPIPASLGFMTANICESLISALLITGFSRTAVRFDRVSQVLLLSIAAVAVNAGTALIGAGTAAVTSKASFWMFWRTWWIADGLGILIVTPIIVTLADVKNSVRSIRIFPALEFLFFMALWNMFAYLLFNHADLAHAYYLQPYMLTALIVWAALRFGIAGTSAAAIFLTAIMITSGAVQTGPLSWGGEDMEARLLQSQVFVGLCSFTGYLLAAGYAQLRNAEKTAHEREQLYLAMFEKTNAVKLLIDPTDGSIIDANAAAAAYYGYTLAVLKTMKISDINTLPPETIRQEMAHAVSERRTYFNFRHRLASGIIRDVEVYSSPMDIGGRTLLLSLVHDITERKQAEEALRRSEVFLDTVIEDSPFSLWISDANGTLIRSNKALREIFRVTDDEVVGKYNLFHDDMLIRQGLLPQVQRVFEQGATARFVIAYDTSELSELSLSRHSVLELDTTISPVLDAQGKVSNAIIQHVDISERKKAEAALIQADKMSTLGILATGIAHEVNQPLMAISMALDNIMLRRDMNYTSTKVADMKQYLQRITAIIDSIRTFAREQKEYRDTAFSINASIQNVIDMLGAQYRSHGIGLRIALNDALPQIRGDIYRFEQVVINLLTNANYAVEQRSAGAGPDYRREIAVETACEGDEVLLRVRDNGIGMSEEVQRKLFTPFFTTKPTGEGMGMGLSISFGIVKSMGGTIVVESVPDSHTLFTVRLPIKKTDDGA
ncbi:MAG: PAS domain S-box protein [Spirochaetes bacterium]|nr:PAS domain S-box protein [Spirochaetota bacterium]